MSVLWGQAVAVGQTLCGVRGPSARRVDVDVDVDILQVQLLSDFGRISMGPVQYPHFHSKATLQ